MLFRSISIVVMLVGFRWFSVNVIKLSVVWVWLVLPILVVAIVKAAIVGVYQVLVIVGHVQEGAMWGEFVFCLLLHSKVDAGDEL